GIELDAGSGFLVGVFLSAAQPVDPAPAALAFTNNGAVGLINTDFASLSPLLDQTFFVGDGLTGNGTGSQQVFNVPDGATRLYLGYADGYGYSGPPGEYQDNTYAVTASFNIRPSGTPEPVTTLFAGSMVGFAIRKRFRARIGRIHSA
ncbi:MAG: hypothetical protein ACYC96_10995, partial [Fimbriimonadaceae bacterium]